MQRSVIRDGMRTISYYASLHTGYIVTLRVDMNKQNVKIKRALISVSDKTGIIEFARTLQKLNVEIISTGGTSYLLREANIAVQDVADITAFPEMMDGRIKTLHPKIHGGILGQRDQHAVVAEEHQIGWIDLVVVNLYPFAETIKKPDTTFDDAIENIDIGGPSMIRGAAKNMGWVGVVVDPTDYEKISAELQVDGCLSFVTRSQLATKAFRHTGAYDVLIYDYLAKNTENNQAEKFPEQLHLSLKKYADLRYGENPHQAASAYQISATSILTAKQYQGKQLSYNNIADADAAVNCLREFAEPACVIVKHANPCGVSVQTDIHDAYIRAYQADSLSAFGGIVALNRVCDKALADVMSQVFYEVIIAPGYTQEALDIFSKKQNLRILEWDVLQKIDNKKEFTCIEGGFLIQEKDVTILDKNKLEIVSLRQPTDQEMGNLLFAWRVVKHVKSNAILLARDNVTIGIGAGQVSRIDAVDLAVRKASVNLSESVLASDAFFPFRDSIDRIANLGIAAIIQPGGSIKDDEVIAACNEHNIAMVFAHQRCFKH